MLREDFFQLAEMIAEKASFYGYRWLIMSNGSLLTEEKVKKLKALKLASLQTSLEGMEKNNDEIRGKGSFQKTSQAIKLLIQAETPVQVSLTLTKKNMADVPALVHWLDSLGVRSLGTGRLITWGQGKNLEDYLLQPQELKNYYLKVKEINQELLKKKRKFRVILGCESAIFNSELLLDPLPNMLVYFCGVTSGQGLTIMANGDVLPCRRLPIKVGQALEENLDDIYYSPLMADLRSLNKLHPFCQKCQNFFSCFGGAKCVSYGYARKWDIPDVQCWQAYQKLNQPLFLDKK